MFKKISYILLLLCVVGQVVANDYYVDVNLGNDANSGASWGAGNALQTVNEALALAEANGGDNSIFIMEGTYPITTAVGDDYTFNNSSLHIQGGFATGSTGTDTTQYAQSNTTTLQYSGYNNNLATINVNNTGAGPYDVTIKGMTQTGITQSASATMSFFEASAASGANTNYLIEDMTHTATEIISCYDFQNLLASNSVTFNNTTFDGIYGRSTTKGAAINMDNCANSFNLNTSTITNNNTRSTGLIHIQNSSASPLMNVAPDNIFVDNGSAAAAIFALEANSGDFIIDSLTTPVSGNGGSAHGGAFLRTTDDASSGTITVKKVAFNNNTSANGPGGVITIYSDNGRGDIDLSDNSFFGNNISSAIGGGAILIRGVNEVVVGAQIPNVNISNNIFEQNGITGNAGGGGAVKLYGTDLAGYMFDDITMCGNTYTDNFARGGGGAVLISNVQANLTTICNSDFTGNSTTSNSNGGAINLSLLNSVTNILDNTLCDNHAVTYGGGLYISSPYYGNAFVSTLDNRYTIDACVFANDTATNSGGAIYVSAVPSIEIKNSTFSKNNASTVSAIFLGTFSYDGSVIDSCVIVENEAAGQSAVYAHSTEKSLDVINTNFTNNRGNGNTSGALSIAIGGLTDTATVVNCLFDGNSVESSSSAGAVNGNNTQIIIDGSLFANNYVTSDSTQTNVVNSDVILATAAAFDIDIFNSYLQNPLTTTYYEADNIDPARLNNSFGGAVNFEPTVSNGCSAVPLVLPTDLCPIGVNVPDIDQSTIYNVCPDSSVDLSSLIDLGIAPDSARLVWSTFSLPPSSGDTVLDITNVSTPGAYYALYFHEGEECFGFSKEVVFDLIDCTDTDGDGVIDLDDIDDDNDGVLDAVESPDCFYTAEEAATLDTIRSDFTSPDDFSSLYDDETTLIFNFDNAQTVSVGDNYFVLEYPFAINLTEVTVSNRFAANNTSYLMGSNDGITWTQLTSGAVINSTNSARVYSVDQNSGDYKYYAIQAAGAGTTSSSTYYRVGEITYTLGTYVPSLHIKPVCDSDFDGDGKNNHLDLDSDGDGCSDAVEAGNTNYTSNDTSTFMTGTDVTQNGLLDAFEVGSSGVINYESTYSPYALSTALNACADTDGDGVTDLNDIDDDNDGVLDAVESPDCFYTLDELIEIDTITSTLASLTEAELLLVYDGIENTRSFGLNNENITGETLYEITTAGAVELSGIDVLYSHSIGETGSVIQWQGWNGTEWINVTDSLTQTTATTGTQNFIFTKNLGEYSKYRLYGVSGQTYHNYVYEIYLNAENYVPSLHTKPVCDSDFDGDGKNNHLDLDSDNDGCSDAVEAGNTNYLVNDTSTFMTGTDVTQNGLLDAFEVDSSGLINYVSTYSPYALSTALNACADTDGDGVTDLNDIDDDNDGVLDAVESPDCFYTAEEASKVVGVSSDLTIESSAREFERAIDGVDANTSYTGIANSQSGIGVSIYEITTQIPVAVSSIDFSMYNFAFTSTSDSVKLQGWDGTAWTDLSPSMVASTTNTVQSFPNSINPTTKYEKYRITGVEGVLNRARVQEIYLNLNNYNPSLHTKPVCSTDFDGDGKNNHLDLDSDGDGCSDAVEAGNTNYTLNDTSTFMTGTDVTQNGLLDAFEVDSSGVINYESTYNDYALDSTVNACLDTDGDGIVDLIDIDDDNDGVLDENECAFGISYGEVGTLASFGSAATTNVSNGDLAMNSTTAQGPFELSNGAKFNATYTPAITNTSSTIDGYYSHLGSNSNLTQNIKFTDDDSGNPFYIEGLVLRFSDFEDNTFFESFSEVKINLADGSQIILNNTNGWGDFFTDANGLGLNDVGTNVYVDNTYGIRASYPNLSGVQSGKYLNLNLSEYKVTEIEYSGARFDFFTHGIVKNPISGAVVETCNSDFDGDGIPNYLDTDSDNDGCSDAYEAGVLSSNVDTVAAPYGGNGFADYLQAVPDTNTYNGTYTYSNAVDSTISTCIPILELEPDMNATFVEVPVHGSVNTNDIVPEGSVYGTPVSNPSNPIGGTITMDSSGTYVFTALTPGEYNFVVPVCPPNVTVNCPEEQLTITVSNPLDTTLSAPPTANPDVASVKTGDSLDINVKSNDVCNYNDSCDLNPPTIVTAPAHGTVTVNPEGTISYVPDSGFVGVDSILYSICDDGSPSQCDTEYVVITVVPENGENRTEANDDFATTIGVKPAIGNVLTNDSDPEKDSLRVTAYSVVDTAGTFEIDSAGEYKFVAVAGFAGPVSFVIEVCDDGDPTACELSTLVILVKPEPQDGAALPVELLKFEANDVNNEMVILDWITATEINNDYFTIYKSKDALNWVEVGEVKGAGNSTEVLTYSLTDEDPFDGISYYQLKQTDYNGSSEYSDIRTVEINKVEVFKQSMKVYPNPVKGDYFILVTENVNLNNAAIHLYSALGNEIRTDYGMLKLENRLKFNTHDLADGVYFLQVNDKSIRIIVSRKN